MIVYLLLNTVNNKSYVGQTRSKLLSQRWNKSLNRSVNPHFRRAVQKYGPASFTREILAHCSTRAELDNLERLWISILRSDDGRFGYNIMPGGIGAEHTSESRRKISIARKLYWTKTRRQAHAKKIRQLWKSRSWPERRQIGMKISRALTGIHRRRVKQWCGI